MDKFESKADWFLDSLSGLEYIDVMDAWERYNFSGDLIEDEDNLTWLMCFAHAGEIRAVEILALMVGVDVDVRSSKDNTAIHHAAAKGHTQIIQMLSDRNEWLFKSQNEEGDIPLILAIKNRHKDAAQYIFNQNSSFHGAFFAHIRNRDNYIQKVFDCVKTLLDMGFDANQKKADTLLQMVCGIDWWLWQETREFFEQSQMECINNLIDKGAKVDEISLLRAVDNKNYHLIPLLLAHGANPHRQINDDEYLKARNQSVREYVESQKEMIFLTGMNCDQILAMFDQFELDQVAGQTAEEANIAVL